MNCRDQSGEQILAFTFRMQLIKLKELQCQNDIVSKGINKFADSYCTFASHKYQNKANMQGVIMKMCILCAFYFLLLVDYGAHWTPPLRLYQVDRVRSLLIINHGK